MSNPLCHVTSASRCIRHSHVTRSAMHGVDHRTSVRCKPCYETNLALLRLFNEEPALRFPCDRKVRVDDDLHSEFLIRAHRVRGAELKSRVHTFITEKPTTWLTEKRTEHRPLKPSTPSIFLDSPDLKKHMRSKHGELQAIISAGPSYIMYTAPPVT